MIQHPFNGTIIRTPSGTLGERQEKAYPHQHMNCFILYLLRWQLSTPMLAVATAYFAWAGYWTAAAIANLIGACVFYKVDKFILCKNER